MLRCLPQIKTRSLSSRLCNHLSRRKTLPNILDPTDCNTQVALIWGTSGPNSKLAIGETMKSFRYLALLLTVPFAAQACMAQDAAGCKDSPLVTRFPGSIITSCNDKTDDAFKFDNLGPKKESK